MGARQSRRSVDITTTPKKEGLAAEGGVGDNAAPGDGKLERIEETDTKPTTNGIAPHTDVADDKDKDKDDATEKEKDKEKEEVKAEETKQESPGESPAETAEVTTPTEATTPASPNTATSPDSKETKKKEKMKKKWSFRSISFSKKDKNKPAREEAPKNGDVTKEEPLAEGGEEAENGSGTASSPVEEKSAVSSPTAENEAAPVAPAAIPAATEAKEDGPATAAGSPAEEKTEEPTPSVPTPVPVEAEKKEEVEKVEAEKKVVEVSPAGGQLAPGPVEVSVFRVQTVATQPSIIERKTSEDIPSLPPSSPPPTPIDSSPLQQAQQAAATATALAEAFKLPAEAAHDDSTIETSTLSPGQERDNDPSLPTVQAPEPQIESRSSVDEPRTESTLVPPSVEPLPAGYSDSPNPSVAIADNLDSLSAGDGGQTAEPDVPVLDDALTEIPRSSFPESFAEAPIPEKTESGKSHETKVDEEVVPPSESPGRTDDDGSKLIEAKREEVVVECVVEEETVPEPAKDQDEELIARVIEPDETVQEEAEPVEEVVELCSSDVTIETIVESEEGPVPVSDEILVEAKPAVVIPVDEEVTETTEDVTEIEADVSKTNSESVEVVPSVEDELEVETESDITVPTEETLISEKQEEPGDSLVSQETIDLVRPIPSATSIENVSDKPTNEEESMPPPLPESPVPSLGEKYDSENANVLNTVPSPVVDVEPQISKEKRAENGTPVSLQDERIDTIELSVADLPVPEKNDEPVSLLDISVADANVTYLVSETQTNFPSSRLEHVPSPTDDLPPAPDDSSVEQIDSLNYPLPPEELSCPLDLSESKCELPLPEENVRNPTETLLTPPQSPSSQSNVSITSGLTTSTKDSSQTQLYDDQSNREFKMESVSISLNSYNESDIELKERLAESLAETEKQEENSVSCLLSNNATSSTTVQETHQSTPEPEAPVENNVARDSTIESPAEAVKVTTPAVPSEVPASPPSAPAITEDVASVAKAIEEIDISDKAVAAATIECNTNEIIADAHYQNNINE
ncbi:calphotin-like [Ceratina calcarata]|uniref:Calphotin-like n=1 Tax=Ceratina calcarata TaxID=156304 RepID=A0AAJ7NET9_9HYME|nr:calphotin-like [Ceratina calcarata]XP_017891715.1 calphotin-like [Ceratina calcarata]XP_017891716.1 calphotin-like [Ceratina calcarata]XP_026675048.1 calphotin-like [Ceratina calcarata]